MQQKHIIADITDVIAKAVSIVTKMIHDKLVEAMEQLVIAAAESNKAGELLQMGCQETIKKLKELAVGTAKVLVEERLQRKEGWIDVREEGMGELGRTYTERLKKGIPIVHASAVAKAEIQKRRIRLIKATGMVGEGMSMLTEKQLVEKANLALALMETDMERKPGVVKFIGASKDRGIGGVTYELNSMEVTEWIKGKTVMSAFLANMGSMTDYKEQTYKVVMDWVPVTLESTNLGYAMRSSKLVG